MERHAADRQETLTHPVAAEAALAAREEQDTSGRCPANPLLGEEFAGLIAVSCVRVRG
jgi:hypothetical protein